MRHEIYHQNEGIPSGYDTYSVLLIPRESDFNSESIDLLFAQFKRFGEMIGPDSSLQPAQTFQGLSDNNFTIPPDTSGAVGPGHVLVALNMEVGDQNRRGTRLSATGESMPGNWSYVGNRRQELSPRRVDKHVILWLGSMVCSAGCGLCIVVRRYSLRSRA
ncbi:MAG: hypothetical protein ACJ8FY_11225 [Gemmataceae bacterium]